MQPNLLEVMKARAGAPANDLFAMLWAQKLRAGASSVQTLTGVPPLSFRANGTPLISWSMKGNTQQNGTPSPDNIIMPTFCGVRTGNLWSDSGFSASDINQTHTHTTSNNYGTTLSNTSGRETEITQAASGGTSSYQNGFFFFDVDFSEFSEGDKLVFSFDYIVTNRLSTVGATVAFIGASNNEKTIYTTSGNWGESGTAYVAFSMSSNVQYPYIEVRLCGNSIKVSNVQLIRGTALKDYEPYGWAEKITCAGQTVPVYLGEVPTVRRIKKLVFDGTENWRMFSDGNIYIALSPNQSVSWVRVLSTHFTSSQMQTNGSLLWFVNANVDFDTVEECKTYLAAQYAAGTPVCIWYVLAEPETAIVNEPLAKIGTYADELRSEDAGVSIPTAKGQNTLTVETDLQPSEMTITYKS